MKVKKIVKKKSKPVVKEPYKQGILDGMCGFYSIINSLHYLKDEMTVKKAEKLLRDLVKTKPNTFHKMFLDGTYYENLVDFLKHIIHYERGYADISFRLPFEDDEFDDQYEFFSCLEEELKQKKNSVAIVSIGRPWHHWSVAVNIDLKREKLSLFDSYYGHKNVNILKFDEISVKRNKEKFEFYPFETIIISKK